MSDQDRIRWDRRYRDGTSRDELGLPPVFRPFEHMFPTEGRALDLACGRGAAAVWLALRGIETLGVDVSPVAIDLASRLASEHGVSGWCRFQVHDLDRGLPEGPQVELVLCHLFRDSRLDRAMIERLLPGGLLGVAALSEGGSGPSRYRERPDELRRAFSDLNVLADGDDGKVAWLIGRRHP